MEQLTELGNRLLDLMQGFGIVAVIIFIIIFAFWIVAAVFILKRIKELFDHIKQERERDPYESLFGKDYKKHREMEHQESIQKIAEEKARREADEFELSLIRSHLAQAEISGRYYHSQGMSEEDCDQAIINGIRRMGFTKDKIAAVGYNPDIADKGFYGTGGHKSKE